MVTSAEQELLKSLVKTLRKALPLLEKLSMSGVGSEAEAETPIGKARAPKMIPKKPDREYTEEELAEMDRRQLAEVFLGLGGDPKGLMPTELRTSILEAQEGLDSVIESDEEGEPSPRLSKLMKEPSALESKKNKKLGGKGKIKVKLRGRGA